MSDSFVGEIRAFAHAKIPSGWLAANGALLQINQNQMLYALIGNRFGGDGVKDFKLPDLRGRVPIGYGFNSTLGLNYTVGATGGAETVTLTAATLPKHSHPFRACTMIGTQINKPGSHLAGVAKDNDSGKIRYLYAPCPAIPKVSLHADTITATGDGHPHENMQPFAAVTYCICSRGIWPQRD